MVARHYRMGGCQWWGGVFVFLRRSTPSTPRHRRTKLPTRLVSGVRVELRRVRSALLVIGVGVLPASVRAQATDSLPRLGLGASSAVMVHAGVGQIKHASLGTEVGGTLDLGSIGSRWVRLGVGVDYLAMTIDRPDSLGVRERGDGYVFTAFADVTVIPSLSRRLTPYAGVGVGVDAVGTQISNEQIGALYNTNVFDVHAQLGALVRVTPRSHLTLETRATGARVVRRIGVRVGYAWFYNQLPRRN